MASFVRPGDDVVPEGTSGDPAPTEKVICAVTGCPSSETARTAVVQVPSGPPGRTSWVTTVPSTAGVTTAAAALPSGAVTTTYAGDTIGSLNSKETLVGRDRTREQGGPVHRSSHSSVLQ
ncbi:hypothetical protein NPS01_39500 [Nocardioides psychrotolerans]|uniref:Uncharacterized protein n=1 Tax=Nocardioides psychrotolerans TaxID=1005945 RepID=A0A1I3QVT6_9ACTN|nr:hypothetical protein [Nocardioides psychrotolerans]GEP40287.1 hypothetical protein NPS01_39500 [Nocardioides psychrotolerans]SFJ37860.1 hypothetical protein SAMN05216561_1285 [Nocardioides psychrotolerans]